MNERTYKAYVQILEDELIVATGCTEPIAIAFASAKAAQVLGCEPERISISVSGNIIKNVHSVTVPNTGGQHGVKTAVAAGIAAGDADKGLDVLSGLNDDGRAHMARYLEEHEIRVEFADTSEPFYIDVRVFGDNGGSARVVMAKNHTNVVLVERDGEILQDTRTEDPSDGENALTELLNVADIIEFADTVDLADVEKSSVVRRNTTTPSRAKGSKTTGAGASASSTRPTPTPTTCSRRQRPQQQPAATRAWADAPCRSSSYRAAATRASQPRSPSWCMPARSTSRARICFARSPCPT